MYAACTRRDSCTWGVIINSFCSFQLRRAEASNHRTTANDVEPIIARLSTLHARHRIKYATNYFVCLGAQKQFIHKPSKDCLPLSRFAHGIVSFSVTCIKRQYITRLLLVIKTSIMAFSWLKWRPSNTRRSRVTETLSHLPIARAYYYCFVSGVISSVRSSLHFHRDPPFVFIVPFFISIFSFFSFLACLSVCLFRWNVVTRSNV